MLLLHDPQVRLILGNVLDARTDAILLTVDGEMVVASEKQNDRRYGNIANAFARRWPGVLGGERWYPLRYGSVYTIEPDEDSGCNFQIVMLASVLPHPHNDQALNTGMLKASIRHALRSMMDEVSENGLTSCAMGLIKCGWRLNAHEALQVTLESLTTAFRSSSEVAIEIWVYDAREYEMLSSSVKSK